MKILFTNDDGINAAGINSLVDLFKNSEHEICVVAPRSQRSGTSHSVSIRETVVIEELKLNYYSCSGYPADCVMYTHLGGIDFTPDVVLSGINLGPNLGTDLIYSGTAAAARQASLDGYIGIAISLCDFNSDYDYTNISKYVLKNLDRFLSLHVENSFININFPPVFNLDDDFVLTKIGRRRYSDKLEKFELEKHRRCLYLTGSELVETCAVDTDVYAVQHGKISVSVVAVHPDAF